jgi:predicted ATPase
MESVLNAARKKLNSLKSEWTHAERVVKEEESSLAKAKQREIDVAEAQVLVQELAEKVQQTAHTQISKVVSKCLETVFDSPYEFKVNFSKKRGKTEAELVFIRDGHELDPVNEAGQGTVDVAAFALQLVSLVLARPRRRRFLCVDEPFRNLHGSVWRERLRELVESISVEMGVQMLIFTQDDTDLRIGKVVEL